MTRQKSGPVAVTDDYRALSSELKNRIPNRRLVDILASSETPLLLDLPSLLNLIKRSNVELVESDDDSHHLRATFRDGERSGMREVDLWIDSESGVFLKAEILRRDQQTVALELLDSEPLAEQWYQHEFHFPDREVRRLTADSH